MERQESLQIALNALEERAKRFMRERLNREQSEAPHLRIHRDRGKRCQDGFCEAPRGPITENHPDTFPPLEQEWLELLEENERLRIDLARVNPTAGLEERLLTIPEQYHSRSPWFLPQVGAAL